MVPVLKANFIADWIAYLRTLLAAQGWSADEVAGLADDDVPAHYFDAARRRIAAVPRAIVLADNFSCPPQNQAGWDALRQKIRAGQDLNPHLSLRHASLLNPDGLLAEWGAHHFHLGVAPHPTQPGFIERSGPLLFGLVASDTFYAIGIFGHGARSFADSDILEIIHRNWPDLIARYKANGVTGGAWTEEQRTNLRRANANVMSVVSDGTVYMPTTGGVMASGMNAEAMRAADFWYYRLRAIQEDVQTKLEAEILPSLRANGYTDAPEVEARLRFAAPSELQAFFPYYDVIVRIQIAPSPMTTTSPAFTRLLAQAREMAAESTHPDAATLDVERWLLHWITVPQPALGGRRPEEMLDTPESVEAVSRVMGAIISGVVV